MKPPVFLAALALLLAACGGAPAAKTSSPHFPDLTGRVIDEADLLTPAQERTLGADLAKVEAEVGPQFVVATVPTLEGLPIEEYGVHLARHWGIGDDERDDGLILLIAPAERQARIDVGTGLENRITDPYAARVLQQQLIPRFRAGDAAGGIAAGTQALIARLRSSQSDAEIRRQDGVVT
ncbi:MAG: TPM domain-containing protein [Allosphingosinicella sp.]